MHVRSQSELFFISNFEADAWEYGQHRHTFYELNYIVKGSGIHVINDHYYHYNTGDLFYLDADSNHYYIIEETTQFSIIKFYDSFLVNEQRALNDIAGRLLSSRNRPVASLACSENMRQLHELVTSICGEYEEKKDGFETMLRNTLENLLIVAGRRLEDTSYKNETISNNELLHRIIHYIHVNIGDSEKLHAAPLAAHFFMNPDYIGQFFKRHSGNTLKDYISRYRITQAQNRLDFTRHTVAEIASGLGFTDESHFIRTFKKYTGQSPAEYRKKKTT
ncbi:AraC family transcriptional regulator [Chitinophagaceae bacterium MMS25-I14]